MPRRCSGGAAARSSWRLAVAESSGRAARARAFAGRHETALVALFLLAVLCVYFWRLLLGDELSDRFVLYGAAPWNALAPPGLPPPRSGQGDAATQFFPGLQLVKDQLANGSLPLWNPHIYGGMALAGNMQSALLYPVTWIALAMPVENAFGVIVVLKLLTGGAGAYLFARRAGVGLAGGVIAGLVFMLSAPLVNWAQWPLGTVMSLLPWLLLATDHVARGPTRRAVAGLGAVVALSLAAGHPESAWLSSSAAGVYLVVLAIAEPDRRRALRGAGAWAAGHVLGALAAAAVLVPFWLAYRESITAEVHGEAAGLSLPGWSALLYLMPNAYGDGIPEYVGPLAFYGAVMGYVGIAVLVLAGIALVRRRSDPRALALAAMSVVTLMVLFGVPPVSWIVETVPPYSSGNHVRTLYILALALAVGAGAGASLLARRPLPLHSVAAVGAGIAVVAALLYALNLAGDHLIEGEARSGAQAHFALALAGSVLVIALLGRAPRQMAIALVAIVALLDLGYLREWNAVLPPERAGPPTPPSVEALQRAGEGRVSGIWTTTLPPFTLTPNLTAGYGIDGIQGYDYPQPKRWALFASEVLGVRGSSPEFTNTSPEPRGAALTGLRMMNTRWYMAPPGSLNPNPEALEPMLSGPDATVFDDAGALPRAYVVGDARPVSDAVALETLAAGGLDPRRTALVPPEAPLPEDGSPAMRAVRIVEREPYRVTIEVPDGPPGWLVLADGYSDTWKASVDGRDATIYPTNWVAFGLPLGAGAHRVVFELDTTPFLVGGVLTVLGTAAIVILWAPWRRRSRPAPSVA